MAAICVTTAASGVTAAAFAVHPTAPCRRLARRERLPDVRTGSSDDLVDVRLALDAEDSVRSRVAAAA